MPAGYVIDDARGVVLTRAWGRVTNVVIRANLSAVSAESRFRPDLNQLIDFRGVTEIAMSGSAVHQLARDAPFGRGSRRALVVSSDVAYGMARMYQIMTDAHQSVLQVFTDLDAALEWLDLKASKADVMTALESIVPLAGTE